MLLYISNKALLKLFYSNSLQSHRKSIASDLCCHKQTVWNLSRWKLLKRKVCKYNEEIYNRIYKSQSNVDTVLTRYLNFSFFFTLYVFGIREFSPMQWHIVEKYQLIIEIIDDNIYERTTGHMISTKINRVNNDIRKILTNSTSSIVFHCFSSGSFSSTFIFLPFHIK